MNKLIGLLLFVFVLASCKVKKTQNAAEIISKAVSVSGGNSIENSIISFKFRDKFYKATRRSGLYVYERLSFQNNDTVRDVLSNDGFERFVNGEKIHVADSMALKYSASVNSVHYFSLLPYGLESPAVNKELLGLTEVKGKEYFKIKITFNEAGGGEDFEDVFIYWIDTSSYKIQYLAYSYNESDGVGLRFREAFNERQKEGVRIVDYNNYKPKQAEIKLNALDKAFEKSDLELLSKIELKNVSIKLN